MSWGISKGQNVGYLLCRKDDISTVVEKVVLFTDDQIKEALRSYIQKTYGKEINNISVDAKSRSVVCFVDQLGTREFDVRARYWLIKLRLC